MRAREYLRARDIGQLTGVSLRTVRRWRSDQMNENRTVATLVDVLGFLDRAELTGTRRRDMVSAIKRLCEMAGTTPASARTEPSALRGMLSRFRPAAHGVTAKSYSNLKSLVGAALQLAGVIDPSGRGCARRHPGWGPLLEAVATDQRLSNGLAAFANWCAGQGLSRHILPMRGIGCGC